jgi:hypothetical protein
MEIVCVFFLDVFVDQKMELIYAWNKRMHYLQLRRLSINCGSFVFQNAAMLFAPPGARIATKTKRY